MCCLNSVSYIIFDLDDTLCDYQKAKDNAKHLVNQTLEKLGINVNQFWSIYGLIEPKLFREFLNNSLTKRQYRIRRYSDILKDWHFKPEELSLELNSIYMQEANHKIDLFDDVKPLMELLPKKRVKAVILTNGPSDGQRDKLKALNLSQYVKEIYISEEIGFSKPSIQAFEFVLQALNACPSQVLMVGDSLEVDIKGAKLAAIEAVLVDRENKHSDYAGQKVTSLLDLSKLLFETEF